MNYETHVPRIASFIFATEIMKPTYRDREFHNCQSNYETRDPTSAAKLAEQNGLDVQVGVVCVLLDEFATRLHGFAHQEIKYVICL